jgi:phosphate transport system substrate-binding protein
MRLIGLLALSGCLFSACSEEKRPVHTDTLATGKIDISADETYRPVIEQQLAVFDSSYPESHITAHYKPEAECIRDLLEDRARVILVTRELNATEQKYCEEHAIAPSSLAIARDAIAVVVHPSSPDSLLSMDQLRGILTGQYNKKYTVVFDNQGSSTVRFAEDSILRGAKLGANVFAAKGNAAVVDYVAQNPQAIGLIGLSYVSDTSDRATGSFLTKVKVVAVQNDSTREFLKPYMAYVALRSYPLTRNLFYISRDTWQGLGTGFSNFLSHERGQLIFYHGHLFPLRFTVTIREASLNR